MLYTESVLEHIRDVTRLHDEASDSKGPYPEYCTVCSGAKSSTRTVMLDLDVLSLVLQNARVYTKLR